jgi:hypothetical protein
MSKSIAAIAAARSVEAVGIWQGSEGARSAFVLGFIAWELGERRDPPACLHADYAVPFRFGWDTAGSDAALAILAAQEG